MRKQKILHLITRSVIGGAQDNTFSTCELHDRDRYEVHLAANPLGEWIERARHCCDTFHPLPALVTPVKPWKDLKAFIAIFRLLRREQFDLIHTHTAKAGFLGRVAAWLCRTPVVIHTYHAFPFDDFMPAWKRLLYRTLEKFVQPLTSFFITLSERQRADAERFGMARLADTKAVYTGIDFTKLDRATQPALTREQLGLPADGAVVFTAARLEPAKAPCLLVEAFSRVLKEHPGASLVIAGDGELRSEVKTRIRELNLEDRVKLLGVRHDVPDLLRLADVFAFSSLSEAMGRAMIEAMLVGKPVVAPAINGIPEIVHHEETGLLYEVGEVEQLASGIARLLRNPDERARLGANARLLTRQLFDVHEMVAQIERVYERLLPPSAAAAAITTLPDLDETQPRAAAGGRS